MEIPTKINILIDTREQRPLEFGLDVQTTVGSIGTFDYAVAGDEYSFAIERKSLDDFVSSLAIKKNWERELYKIHRAKIAGFNPIIYVIEAAYEDICQYPYDEIFSARRVHKDFIYHRWRELVYDHKVHVIFAGDRAGAAHAIYLLLKSRTEEMAEEKDKAPEHAKHSPSSLKNKEICPGWLNDPTADTERADEGTKLHLAAQTGNLAGLTDDQAAAVNVCLEYVRELLPTNCQLYREIKLDVDGLTWGTADVVAWDEVNEFVDVVDYKFGRLPVDDAEVNLQGWCYVLGAMKRFGAKKGRVTFILPRLGIVSEHTFSEDDLPILRRRIETVIERAEKHKPSDLNATDPILCKRCGCAGWCVELARRNVKSLSKMGHNLPESLDPTKITEPAQISNVLDIVPAIEQWIKKIKEVALERAKKGEEIPGYHMVTIKGHRTISDPASVWAVLSTFYKDKISADEFVKCCNISVTELDSLLKKLGDKSKVEGELKEKALVKNSQQVSYLRKEHADAKRLPDRGAS